jgi:hypothetical protein
MAESQIDPTSDRFLRAVCRQRASPRHAGHAQAYFEALRVFGRLRSADRDRPDGKPAEQRAEFLFPRRSAALLRRRRRGARDLAANDFKYWELMRRACERGLKVFDYGRSKQGTGSYAFKKNWGFEPQPLHYEYCLYKRDSVPQNNPNNAKYKLLIETWRRMPIGWPTGSGPHSCATWGGMAAVATSSFLVHRLPYPPNKGDKVRSYHLLRTCRSRHRVFLGTFIDDPDDEAMSPPYCALCADLHVDACIHAAQPRSPA